MSGVTRGDQAQCSGPLVLPAQLTQDGDVEGWEVGGNLAVIRQTWKCRYQQAVESEQRKGSRGESPTSQLTVLSTCCQAWSPLSIAGYK